MNQRRIETVVRVRELRERIARGELARRRLALAAQQRAEDAAWAVVRAADGPTAGSAPELQARRAMLRAGVRDAIGAGEQTAVAEQHAHVALDGWHDAARRLDGIERLAARLAAEAEAERERRAMKELDDIVIGRWPMRGDAS